MTEDTPAASAAPLQSPTLSLAGRVAIVAGAGQTPGPVIGNGRATALLFARAGAHVIALDRDRASAQETVAMIAADGSGGGGGEALVADVTEEPALIAAVRAIVDRHGRIDVLQNNVGVAYTGGDSPLADLDEASFDRVMAINLRGTVMACKHVVPVMRGQGSGVITNISSIAAAVDYKSVTYKASKAGMIAFSRQLALDCAADGVRVNAILPGYMDTPMAVDTQARRTGRPREEIADARDRTVPLKGGMGSAWDVAQASLFLASDAARFITGVALPVDGGTMARIG
jgi:NAD(P)-dependent dehydrogenase (short-subunit alcohol dehydrogenase family)